MLNHARHFFSLSLLLMAIGSLSGFRFRHIFDLGISWTVTVPTDNVINDISVPLSVINPLIRLTLLISIVYLYLHFKPFPHKKK